MIFVDANVFMYAVGGPHLLRTSARDFLRQAHEDGTALCTSAEVLQELMHAYLRVARLETLEAALFLTSAYGIEVWPLDADDVMLARQLHDRYPSLSARDLCHLASCRRRGVHEVKTFDEGLRAVVG